MGILVGDYVMLLLGPNKVQSHVIGQIHRVVNSNCLEVRMIVGTKEFMLFSRDALLKVEPEDLI